MIFAKYMSTADLLPDVPSSGLDLDARILHADLERVIALRLDAARRVVQHVARTKLLQHAAEGRCQVFAGNDRGDETAGLVADLIGEVADGCRRYLGRRANQ